MLQVVWFKRDLRFTDHWPPVRAAKTGPVLALYVFEPEMMEAPDYSNQHFEFIKECLICLQTQLHLLGVQVSIEHAPMLSVLQSLKEKLGEFELLSHEETGNFLSYERDRAVTRWCLANGVVWHQFPNNGVVRRLSTRNIWSKLWVQRMSEDVFAAPAQIQPCDPRLIRANWPDQLSHKGPDIQRQRGGLKAAHATMKSFLAGRGAQYKRAMSSPLSAQLACSRISPYLAFGVVSIRQVVNELAQAREYWRGLDPALVPTGMLASITSFESRLHWHCHFIQKLESQPSIEFENIHRAYDGMRSEHYVADRLQAWCKGETGYPMIDACMRMLASTGWINFRMRAMLISFASYQLWLHWREPALHLARQFLDYEPGIHYPQIQMQSGTTGINTIRMYNPVKQARDHDPSGEFVQRWIPALRGLPKEHLFEPWLTPPMIQIQVGCVLGRDYPMPIIDLEVSSRFARDTVWGARKGDEFKIKALEIVEQHASRNPRREGIRRKAKAPEATPQFDLFS